MGGGKVWNLLKGLYVFYSTDFKSLERGFSRVV